MTPPLPYVRATFSCGCETAIHRSRAHPPRIDPVSGPSVEGCPTSAHYGNFYVTKLEWVEPLRASPPVLADQPRHVAVGFTSRNHQETQRIVDMIDDQLHSLGLDLAVYRVAPL